MDTLSAYVTMTRTKISENSLNVFGEANYHDK